MKILSIKSASTLAIFLAATTVFAQQIKGPIRICPLGGVGGECSPIPPPHFPPAAAQLACTTSYSFHIQPVYHPDSTPMATTLSVQQTSIGISASGTLTESISLGTTTLTLNAVGGYGSQVNGMGYSPYVDMSLTTADGVTIGSNSAIGQTTASLFANIGSGEVRNGVQVTCSITDGANAYSGPVTQ